jgi:hypothetical protein
MSKSLFVFNRIPDPSSLRLVAAKPEGEILLLGPAVLCDPSHFSERKVFVLSEEMPQWGESQVASSFWRVNAEDVIPMLLSHKVFSL